MRQAKVLRLLREDARMWWYHANLRKWGQVDKAIQLERKSIRSKVAFIRENVHRPMRTHRDSVIEFTDSMYRPPFSLEAMNLVNGRTASVSGCHRGFFAAWVYCYANRIGFTWKAKEHDYV